MKRITFCIAMLLSFVSSWSVAQTARLTLGDIDPFKMEHGVHVPTKTTRAKIISSDRLIMSDTTFKVISYSCSIAKGSEVWGPINVKGPSLAAVLIEQIKKTPGPRVNIFFENIRVKEGNIPARKWTDFKISYDE